MYLWAVACNKVVLYIIIIINGSILADFVLYMAKRLQ